MTGRGSEWILEESGPRMQGKEATLNSGLLHTPSRPLLVTWQHSDLGLSPPPGYELPEDGD